jgi:hypothetical protein
MLRQGRSALPNMFMGIGGRKLHTDAKSMMA